MGMLIFARKFAGSDSWIDSHNFNGDILSHFLWRLNSSADLIVSAAAGLNASLNSYLTHNMQKYIQNDYPFCGGLQRLLFSNILDEPGFLLVKLGTHCL